MKRLFLILAVLATTLSCAENNTGTHYSLGFVSEYYSPDRMKVEQRPYFKNLDITIGGKGYQYSNGKSEEYLNCAQKNGDTKYKNQLLPFSNPALTQEPSGITVICDRDIDGAHPAGAALDDVILILGWTYSEYINSGYRTYTKEVTETYGYNISSRRDIGHSPFFKYLKDIKRSDLKLMKPEFLLYPPQDWAKGEYNLTITMFFDDFELSETVTYTVE